MTHKEIVPAKGASSVAAMLDYKTSFSDCDATTLREYFHTLLRMLWRHGEGFDSKRPFGNSGWDNDVYLALVEMKAVKGKIVIDGGYSSLDSCDYDEANKLVEKLLKGLCSV